MKKRSFRLVVYSLLCGALLVLVSETLARKAGVFDQLDLLVDIRHELVNGYVETPDQTRMMQSAVRGMVESLNDPYTIYISPEELTGFDKQIRGTFSGIGAEVDIHLNRLHIISPLEESPAWKAGVMAGDTVMEINGESTLNIKITDAITKLQGAEGTPVKLKIRHETGEEKEVTITRARINVATIKGINRDAEGKWNFMLDDANKIGYVRLSQFTDKTAADLRAALDKLLEQKVRGLILDMRFNPGGLLESAVEVSDMFLDKGKRIVSVKGRVVPEKIEWSTQEGTIPPIPMVVIANEASASAAEVVTGALSDNERAVFIGTRTFGKGSVQQVMKLDGEQGALKITNAYYYLPNGRNIHRREGSDKWGVDPGDGFYVPMSPEEVKKMVEQRREGDVLRKAAQKQQTGTITPAWIREQMSDPQLAAAQEALVGKLAKGEWPKVGQSNAQLLAHQAKRDNLVRQRDLIKERLAEIEVEIGKTDAAATQPATEPATQADLKPAAKK